MMMMRGKEGGRRRKGMEGEEDECIVLAASRRGTQANL